MHVYTHINNVLGTYRNEIEVCMSTTGGLTKALAVKGLSITVRTEISLEQDYQLQRIAKELKLKKT